MVEPEDPGDGAPGMTAPDDRLDLPMVLRGGGSRPLGDGQGHLVSDERAGVGREVLADGTRGAGHLEERGLVPMVNDASSPMLVMASADPVALTRSLRPSTPTHAAGPATAWSGATP